MDAEIELKQAYLSDGIINNETFGASHLDSVQFEPATPKAGDLSIEDDLNDIVFPTDIKTKTHKTFSSSHDSQFISHLNELCRCASCSLCRPVARVRAVNYACGVRLTHYCVCKDCMTFSECANLAVFRHFDLSIRDPNNYQNILIPHEKRVHDIIVNARFVSGWGGFKFSTDDLITALEVQKRRYLEDLKQRKVNLLLHPNQYLNYSDRDLAVIHKLYSSVPHL